MSADIAITSNAIGTLLSNLKYSLELSFCKYRASEAIYV